MMTTPDLSPFLDALSAKTPAPGGGAAGPAAGAIAAALASMVVAYSIDKASLAEHRPALTRAAGELDRVRSLLLRLGEEDAAAYAAYSSLRRLDANDPARVEGEPEARAGILAAPRAAVAAACDLLRLLETLPGITNRNLRSDLAASAALAEASARASAWSVRANLYLLHDDERADSERGVESALADAASRRVAIEGACA